MSTAENKILENPEDTTTRDLVIIMANLLAKQERTQKLECPAPAGMFEQHSKMLDELHKGQKEALAGQAEIKTGLAVIVSEYQNLNRNIGTLFAKAEANRADIEGHDKDLIVIKTEKKTKAALIIAGISAVTSMCIGVWAVLTYFHQAGLIKVIIP